MLTLLRALAANARASLPARCRHSCAHDHHREHDGTQIDHCPACGTHWVTGPRGTRVRVPSAR